MWDQVEYTSRPGEHVLLADRYVEPLIIQRHREKKEKEKEIRYRGEDFHHARTYHTDHHITVDKLFSQDDSPNSVPPKAVILQGNSGSGKSFTAQKILYEWANGNLFSEIFDVVFHLRCSELNDIAEDISLVELLNCSEEMAQILRKIPERVLFLVDGFDELRLSLPKKPLPLKAEPGAMLSSLLNGFILKESFLLVTTRSIAAEKLGKLLKFPQRFTEIMGFSKTGIQEYFQKFFESDERWRQVYEEVKANGTLYAACSSPVMCWLVCSVFKEKSKMSKMTTHRFRSTTSIFVDFVFILLEHHCPGLTESQQRDLLKDLGQLAHKGIHEGQVLFQRNKVPETILNVLHSTSIPFLSSFHYRGRINVKEMFSFMHLSFQEFFAALFYTFLDETESKIEIEKLLSISDVKSYHVLPIIQCLFGLSNQAVNNLLMKKHQQAMSHATCDQLQEWLYEFVSHYLNAHLHNFVLQCLYEGNNNHVVQNAMNIWETAESGIKIELSSSNTSDYHAAAYCLQFCRHIRTMNLQGSTMENLIMLEEALSKCDELQLVLSSIYFIVNTFILHQHYPAAVFKGVIYCISIVSITVSPLLGRLSTRFRNVFMGIFDHSSRSTFMRSDLDVGQEGLACSLHSNSSQRCSIGLRSGLCAGQSSSSTPNSLIHVFMDPALCTAAQSCWNRKGPSPNCSPQSWEHEILQNLLV
uniref:NACHT domain-containing protein n=1 Tax=Pygocentrus nattereri TaxID=42514 RepID=A0A3B4DS63_PYGNA